uniref:Uncharacterized protein n=1 Tax=Hucho hucho TaxID=62062 RepID=A0A4W5QW72_9TELE
MKLSVLVVVSLLHLGQSCAQAAVIVNKNYFTSQQLSWNGSLLTVAVGIYNSYTEHTDYICKYNCEAGFYTRGLTANTPTVTESTPFEILTNTDHFEFHVLWSEHLRGEEQVRLGEVVPQFEAFFLPWEGDEYWYKTYQVLTINRDAYSQHISHVKYGIDEVEIFHYPPRNHAHFQHHQQRVPDGGEDGDPPKRRRWRAPGTSDVPPCWFITTGITAKIPLTGSGGVEFSGEKTLQFSRGTTMVEAHSHSVSVELKLPPNHSCTVYMEGRKITADIPFTARLSHMATERPIYLWGVQCGSYRRDPVTSRPEFLGWHAKPCP